MFGFVTADSTRLSEEQIARYRAVYCGLCRTIGERHGPLARLSLTYDLAFLVLLLDALEEPEQRTGAQRCPAHPLRPQRWRRSRWTEYAADMNVALAYHKCLDDWRDEKRPARLVYARALEGAWKDIRRRWPAQCGCIEAQLRRLDELERSRSADLDAASAAFGALMAELFAAPGGFFAPQLRAMGAALGRFIYVMDAALDEREDAKRGRWNPVTRFRERHGRFDARAALELLLGEAALAFEQLPLERDLDLLRNVLYSGVWLRWEAEKRRGGADTPPDERQEREGAGG